MQLSIGIVLILDEKATPLCGLPILRCVLLVCIASVVSTTSDGLQEVSVLVKWFGLSFERARGIFWCLLRLRLQVPDSELLRELWTFWDCSRMALWIRTHDGL